jgi:hypothetical protein
MNAPNAGSEPLPLRISIYIPAVPTAEIVALVDLLDQLLAQLWAQRGDDIADFMLRDRRRHTAMRATPDLPF